MNVRLLVVEADAGFLEPYFTHPGQVVEPGAPAGGIAPPADPEARDFEAAIGHAHQRQVGPDDAEGVQGSARYQDIERLDVQRGMLNRDHACILFRPGQAEALEADPGAESLPLAAETVDPHGLVELLGQPCLELGLVLHAVRHQQLAYPDQDRRQQGDQRQCSPEYGAQAPDEGF